MLLFLTQGLVLGATAAMQPGPYQAYLLSQTIRYGWRKTLPAAFAPLISDGPIILLVIFVLTNAPEWSLVGLQIAGGLFLIYLAYGAYRSFQTAVTTGPEDITGTPQRSLLKGALLNALSPNPYIFWATIAGPIFIEGWRQAPRYGLSFISGFYIALIGGFMTFIALFSLTNRLDARVTRALSGFSAVALFLFGLFQLGQGLLKLNVL
jgi:threonine/homoserine/homoserine lactone efflux protein